MLVGPTSTRSRLQPTASLSQTRFSSCQRCKHDTKLNTARVVCNFLHGTFVSVQSVCSWASAALVPRLTINFRNRFTSEFLFPCHCISETLKTPCCSHIVLRQFHLDVASGSSAKSISYVPRTSGSWMPHVRLIFQDRDSVSSIDQCCN